MLNVTSRYLKFRTYISLREVAQVFEEAVQNRPLLLKAAVAEIFDWATPNSSLKPCADS